MSTMMIHSGSSSRATLRSALWQFTSCQGVPGGFRSKRTTLGCSFRISSHELTTISMAASPWEWVPVCSPEVWKAADFTLIGGDLLNTPGEEIRNLSVEMTVVDGEVVYQAG